MQLSLSQRKRIKMFIAKNKKKITIWRKLRVTMKNIYSSWYK